MSRKFFASLFIFGLFVTPARAEVVQLAPGHPESHVVVKGDTLWDISARFLAQPWRWPEIWDINPQIENPHLIYPGDIIRLVYDTGRPRLRLERGAAVSPETPPGAVSPQPVQGDASGVARPGGRDVKLSPQIRAYARTDVIPPLSLEIVRPFLLETRIVDKDDYLHRPYILAIGQARKRAARTGGPRLIGSEGIRVHASGFREDAAVAGLRYSVYRQREEYRGPPTEENKKGELLGYEVLYIGDIRLTESGDPAPAVVVDMVRHVKEGDRLYPVSARDRTASLSFVPGPPANEVSARIISIFDALKQGSKNSVIVLDAGERDGLEPGNILHIYHRGTPVPDPIGTAWLIEKELKESAEQEDWLAEVVKARAAFDKTRLGRYLGPSEEERRLLYAELSEEYSGTAMVFRTYERLSYALVTESVAAVQLHDTLRNP